jgi:Ca2+-binding RTX toxin-like protein
LAALTGGTGADNLVLSGAALSGDSLNTISGFEDVTLTGNADSFDISLANLTALTTLDGGAGTNVMTLLDAGTLDLTSDVTLTNVQTIDLADGANTFTNDNTARTINGGTGDDTITGGTAADIINGGAGVDTINGGAGTDTINGDDGDDIIDGGDDGDIIDGGAGDDTITDTGGSDTISGGTNTGVGDTLDYSSAANAISSATFTSASDVTINSANGDVDDIDGIENFVLSGNDDTITLDADNLGDFSSIDGDAGTDTVNFTGTIAASGTEGATFASVFTNVEELDFSGATLSDGDFTATLADIDTLMGSTAGDITITVSTGDSVTIGGTTYSAANTYALDGDTNLILQTV